MKSLKRIIAISAAAMMLTAATVTSASASAIGDFFKGVGGTIVHGLETTGAAVVGAGRYVFTDADGEESFADMKKAASKTADCAVEAGKNVVQAGVDVMNFQTGSYEMIVGAVATGGAAAIEGVSNLVTGNDDYSWTKAASGILKDGYDRYDSGYDTAVDIASMAGGPVGSAVAHGCKVLKTAGEAAVGYKDRTWDDVKDAAKDAVIDVAVNAAGGIAGGVAGATSEISEATKEIITTTVSSAADATVNIVSDLNDPNNERSAAETVVEDLVTTVVSTGAGSGVEAAAN